MSVANLIKESEAATPAKTTTTTTRKKGLAERRLDSAAEKVEALSSASDMASIKEAIRIGAIFSAVESVFRAEAAAEIKAAKKAGKLGELADSLGK